MSTPFAAVLYVVTSLVSVTNAIAGSLTTDVNGVRVELTSAPDVPVTHTKTVYAVRLTDSAGKPVTDARVTLTGRMEDGMSAATPLRRATESGVYRGEVLFTMEGPWDLTIRVVTPSKRVEIPLREDVTRRK